MMLISSLMYIIVHGVDVGCPVYKCQVSITVSVQATNAFRAVSCAKMASTVWNHFIMTDSKVYL